MRKALYASRTPIGFSFARTEVRRISMRTVRLLTCSPCRIVQLRRPIAPTKHLSSNTRTFLVPIRVVSRFNPLSLLTCPGLDNVGIRQISIHYHHSLRENKTAHLNQVGGYTQTEIMLQADEILLALGPLNRLGCQAHAVDAYTCIGHHRSY